MVYGTCLENKRTERFRGFKSLPLRQDFMDITPIPKDELSDWQLLSFIDDESTFIISIMQESRKVPSPADVIMRRVVKRLVWAGRVLLERYPDSTYEQIAVLVMLRD